MRRLWPLVFILVGAVTLAGCSADSIFEYKSKAGIQVITDGITSAVYLNEQYLDNTPLIQKDLKPGEYTLRIEPIDTQFVPHETAIKLNKGMLTVVTWKPGTRPELSGGVIYEMEPIKESKTAEVVFNTIPEGAIVALENKEKEFSPVVFSHVEAGNKEYEVTLPSYETQRHTLNVQAGHRMIVTIKLAKLVPVEDTVPHVSQNASVSADLEQGINSGANLTPEQAATASANDKRVVLTKPTGLIQDGKEVLRVRSEPDIASTELGIALVGSTHPYLGETANSWYKISFENQVGWVSAEFTEITSLEP